VYAALADLGFHVLKRVVPAGEESKSGEQYLRLLSFMAAEHVTRSDVIFALGGGVVGDLSGFLAATYQRGIDFVQLPTTLLAAVDSSVGGKTAINLPEGKNLAGTFKQPACVIMDTDTLETLDESVFADGCAEVIKYGMIWDGELFEMLQNHVLTEPEQRKNTVLLIDVISCCVDIKREIVIQDELDKGIRNILNFGHTVGHSIEKKSGFEISHGAAVAMGMAIVTEAAEKVGICGDGITEELRGLLTAYGLPVEAPFAVEELIEGILSDKKIDYEDEVVIQYSVQSITEKDIYTNLTDTIVVGKHEPNVGIDKALQELHYGSSAKVILPSHLAYGFVGDADRIGTNMILIYDIKIEQ
jgi:3-dehydroquinate synthase